VASEQGWTIEVTGPARRALERLPEKAAAAIAETFSAIAANPHRLGRPLKLDLEGVHAARRGPYRVLYEIDEERRLVTVLAVGHRADVYRTR